MTANKKRSYREELIKEALRCELDSITPPPPELMWKRIQSGLEQKTRAPAPLRRSFAWQRYSAVAAALLIFFLGSLGIYRAVRMPYLASPDAGKNGDANLLGMESLSSWDFPEGWAPAVAPRTDTRTTSIAGGFIPEQEHVYGEVRGEAAFIAAVYSRNGESLLWVRAGLPAPDLALFLADLGKALGVEFQITRSPGNDLFFEAEGRPGLAWHTAGLTQALWALTGAVTAETLQDLQQLK